MAGRILNRQARTKALYNLLAVIPTVCTYDGLKAALALAEVVLDAGPDVEKCRDACNARRVVLLDFKQKERKVSELFTK